MKIHLKDNKIALYDIESDYRQYLFQYDFRVNLKLQALCDQWKYK